MIKISYNRRVHSFLSDFQDDLGHRQILILTPENYGSGNQGLGSARDFPEISRSQDSTAGFESEGKAFSPLLLPDR